MTTKRKKNLRKSIINIYLQIMAHEECHFLWHFSQSWTGKRVRIQNMTFRKAVRLLSILLLISVFIYWTVTAFEKYLSEPISTSIEYRVGDDNKNNFVLPIFTFCPGYGNRLLKCPKPIRQLMFDSSVTTDAAIECMKEYDNFTEFLDAIDVPMPVVCKYL